uniref:Putative secreted protein n=1 Tax=Anopheles darlingi TaxID=43151 RepID=A0A2M4DNE1_ANODA
MLPLLVLVLQLLPAPATPPVTESESASASPSEDEDPDVGSEGLRLVRSIRLLHIEAGTSSTLPQEFNGGEEADCTDVSITETDVWLVRGWLRRSVSSWNALCLCCSSLVR